LPRPLPQLKFASPAEPLGGCAAAAGAAGGGGGAGGGGSRAGSPQRRARSNLAPGSLSPILCHSAPVSPKTSILVSSGAAKHMLFKEHTCSSLRPSDDGAAYGGSVGGGSSSVPSVFSASRRAASPAPASMPAAGAGRQQHASSLTPQYVQQGFQQHPAQQQQFHPQQQAPGSGVATMPPSSATQALAGARLQHAVLVVPDSPGAASAWRWSASLMWGCPLHRATARPGLRRGAIAGCVLHRQTAHQPHTHPRRTPRCRADRVLHSRRALAVPSSHLQLLAMHQAAEQQAQQQAQQQQQQEPPQEQQQQQQAHGADAAAPRASSVSSRVPAFSCLPLDVSGQPEGSAASPRVGFSGVFVGVSDTPTPDSLSPNSGCTVVRGCGRAWVAWWSVAAVLPTHCHRILGF
jgi:hypothetical protein